MLYREYMCIKMTDWLFALDISFTHTLPYEAVTQGHQHLTKQSACRLFVLPEKKRIKTPPTVVQLQNIIQYKSNYFRIPICSQQQPPVLMIYWRTTWKSWKSCKLCLSTCTMCCELLPSSKCDKADMYLWPCVISICRLGGGQTHESQRLHFIRNYRYIQTANGIFFFFISKLGRIWMP